MTKFSFIQVRCKICGHKTIIEKPIDINEECEICGKVNQWEEI